MQNETSPNKAPQNEAPGPRQGGPREASGGASDATPHDALLHELEDHTPEGRGPRPRTVRREVFLFAPLVVTSIVGGAIALHHIGGWGAVALGALFFVVYYGLGWWPVLAAGVLRRKQRHQLEAVVAREIKEHPPGDHGADRDPSRQPTGDRERQRPSG